MQIYDSKQKKKLELIPIKDKFVSIYVCGPTVYDDAHLGHAKSAISFDLLRRTLLNLGFAVKFVRNYTDIDDKILKKMSQSGQSLEEITNRYTKSYEDDMKSLNVLAPDIAPKATECIKDIVCYIQDLQNRGFTYTLKDGIYFDTSKDKHYLSLSARKDENLQARVANNDDKKDPKDFVLWKFDENWYESKLGKGRPGWHSECVAMIKKYFSGDENYEIDIHAGGLDLLFPHHENESAQCRCAYQKNLAKYWLHNGFVQISGEKMSKSLGNSFFVKDALNLVPGEALRFYLMSSHYRANFNYSIQDLLSSKKRLDKIYRLKKRLNGVLGTEVEAKFKSNLLEFMSDDLNISGALSVLDEMLNLANEKLDKEPKNKAYKQILVANLEFVSNLLGILKINEFEWFQWGVSDKEKIEISNLIQKRNDAKKEKNFALADEIRSKLEKMGICIMDTPNGTIWEKV